jgi:hypothetical protein
MLNERLLQAESKYSDETRMLFSMRRAGFDQLTPEHVSTVLARYNDEAVQEVLDLWSDFDAQVDSDLASGDINQILGEQVVSAAAEAQAEVDKLYSSEWLGKADERAASAKSQPSNVDRATRLNNAIENTDEFVDMMPEVAATAEHTMSLRDPETRSAMGPMAFLHATDSARRLTNDIAAAKTLFDQLRATGVDPAPLENVLRAQLDKHGLGELLSMDAYPPVEMRRQGDQALLAFRQVEDTGKPAEKEAVALVDQIATGMANSSSANGHGTYASIINQAVKYQRGHGGVSPALADAVQGAAAHDRFGFMHETLTGLDLDLAVADGDAEAVSDLTNGRQALVVWGNETTLSPDLVTDDRSGTSSEQSVIADIMFREGMGEITPNVAAALNSMYAAFGGSIHRTDDNITEASTERAEMWKQAGSAWRSNEGADTRTPEQVTGVYTGVENQLIVADKTFREGDGVVNTVTHELGHALDSMLADVSGYGAYYSLRDPEYDAFRTKLKEIASYGDGPNDTVLNWYYRNQDEGATENNGYSGTTESWAQAYAAYAAMRRLEDSDEGLTQEQVWGKGGGSMLHGHIGGAREAGVSLKDLMSKRAEAGKAIYEFFDDFENRRLPEIMKTPVAVKKRGADPNKVAAALGAPPPQVEQPLPNAVQVARASAHDSEVHGSLNMAQIRPGDQNWDSVLTAMKEQNPDFTGPSEKALGVWYNRDWASQNGTLLMKVIMPGNDTPTSIYDFKHSKTGNAQKFQREKALHRVHADLREKALSEAMDDPVAALVATLIETGMRVDNGKGKQRTKSTKRKKLEQVIGGTSLMPKHLTFNKDSMRFQFMGKSGIDNDYTIKEPRLQAALQKWSQGKGRNDFLFGDVTAKQSIDYLRDATGISDLINHDLRTYVATNSVRQWLSTLPAYKKKGSKDKRPVRPKKGMSQEEFDKFKIHGWKVAGERINDGWGTVRDHYVSPSVWWHAEEALGLPHSFDELIEYTGVPEHPAAAPPAEPAVPVAAAAAAEDDSELVSRPEQIDYSPEAVRERDEFYDSFEWAGVSPTAPPPPLPPGSAPEGDEDE